MDKLKYMGRKSVDFAILGKVSHGDVVTKEQVRTGLITRRRDSESEDFGRLVERVWDQLEADHPFVALDGAGDVEAQMARAHELLGLGQEADYNEVGAFIGEHLNKTPSGWEERLAAIERILDDLEDQLQG